MSPIKIEFTTYNRRGAVLNEGEKIVQDGILAELVTDVGKVTAETHIEERVKEGWLNGLLNRSEEVVVMESTFPESGSQKDSQPNGKTVKLERKQFYPQKNGVETRVSASYVEVYSAK